MYGWITTRSGRSPSSRSGSTCSSQMRTSSSSRRYPASVARPSGGKSEYLIGRKNGLVASVSAGRIIFTCISVALLAEEHHGHLTAARTVEVGEEHPLPASELQPAVHDVEADRRWQQQC